MLVIAPWNYPYLTAVNTIVPALMAGNAVILKHAAQTLLVGERFQQAMDAAGLPDGLFQHLILGHEDVGAHAGLRRGRPRQLHGSVAGGQAIERAAAGTFTASASSSAARTRPMSAPTPISSSRSKIWSTARSTIPGQCCCGIERIYVHERLYRPFVDGFVDADAQISCSAIRWSGDHARPDGA